MLEIARPADVLDPTSDDSWRAPALVAADRRSSTTVMVGSLACAWCSRPITKLLRGIDDVAKGDLSHVILSERDDEIGAIATRFNEMTFSLRESRGETQRQNEAKLALEQRLGQTEKLATIGQLAAEIAHEVGTPLNVIAGRARSIQRSRRIPRRSRRTPRSSPSRPRGSRASSSACSTSRAARSARPSAARSTSTSCRARRWSCSPASSRARGSRPGSSAPRACRRSPATPTACSRC